MACDGPKADIGASPQSIQLDGDAGAGERLGVLRLLLLHLGDVGLLQAVGSQPVDVGVERVALVVGGQLGVGDAADRHLAQAADPVLAAAPPHTSG